MEMLRRLTLATFHQMPRGENPDSPAKEALSKWPRDLAQRLMYRNRMRDQP
jgi:hypothetical protein